MDMIQSDKQTDAERNQKIIRIIFAGVMEMILTGIENGRRDASPLYVPKFSAFVKYLSAGSGEQRSHDLKSSETVHPSLPLLLPSPLPPALPLLPFPPSTLSCPHSLPLPSSLPLPPPPSHPLTVPSSPFPLPPSLPPSLPLRRWPKYVPERSLLG